MYRKNDPPIGGSTSQSEAASLCNVSTRLVQRAVLERAEHLAKRKGLYEAKHPETRHGGDRRSNQVPESGTRKGTVPSFVTSAQKLTGAPSASTIYEETKIANQLSPVMQWHGSHRRRMVHPAAPAARPCSRSKSSPSPDCRSLLRLPMAVCRTACMPT